MFRNFMIVLLCAVGFLAYLAVHVFIRRQFGLSDVWATVCSLPFAAANARFCYSMSRWLKT